MKQPLLTTDYLDRAVDLFGDDIGVIADDKEDGDDSFVFRMPILDIDLED